MVNRQVEIIKILTEFNNVVDSIIGLFLDSTQGFAQNAKRVAKNQINPHASFIFADGDPTDPDAIILHECNMLSYLTRNGKGAGNEVMLGNLFVITIYQFWEHEFRPRLADIMQIDRGSIKAPIFGDMRIFRQCILHHFGICTVKVNKCEIMKIFRPGDQIKTDEKFVRELVIQIRNQLNELAVKYAGQDPGFGRRQAPTGHRRL